MAWRNALAVGLPLAVAIAIGQPLGGIAVATGALNVSFSDGTDPYAHRARRMLTWSFLGALTVFIACLTGRWHLLAVVVACAWAVGAGMLVSISARAADLGLNTLVTLIVYAARGALSPEGALIAGSLVLAGGLLQTALAILFWPLRRSMPERQAVGRVYLELSEQIGKEPVGLFSSSLMPQSGEIQDILSALGRDHSAEGERLRLLFDQADRLRFSIYSLSQLRQPLKGQQESGSLSSRRQPVDALDQTLELARKLLNGIAQSLIHDDRKLIPVEIRRQLAQIAEEAQPKENSPSDSVKAFGNAVDLAVGQLRVVTDLAVNTTTEGAEEFAKSEVQPPFKLQMRSWIATIRANFTLQSPAFRHSLRLAVCVAIGDAIGRSVGTQRNYWLAMTVAVVLKPDFTGTISRGILRLSGTFAGLTIATLLFHVLRGTALTQLALVTGYTFLLRFIGPANYGVFSVAISGLIVFLIAASGVLPADVVAQRAINTAIGGMLALVAYLIWPTWERRQVPEELAEMIDATRDYFHAVSQKVTNPTPDIDSSLDEKRNGWRQARSQMEASADRFASEPRSNVTEIANLTSILASSHILARSIMAIEAASSRQIPDRLISPLRVFGTHVEFTLYYLAESLRGSTPALHALPQLREDHRNMLNSEHKSGITEDSLLLETDRLIVSLNTLREQVSRYVTHHRNPATSH
jgi:uncharacterized membrane protein YccC